MLTYHAYAAPSAKAPLEPFAFDPGPLGPEEVEIEVSHCGLCHSDLSMLDNDWGMSKYPFVPGHEVTGTVSALGEQAKGLTIGQRVGLGWFSHSCLSCHQCLSGDHNLCPTAQGTIVGRHGGFAVCAVFGENASADGVSGGELDQTLEVYPSRSFGIMT